MIMVTISRLHLIELCGGILAWGLAMGWYLRGGAVVRQLDREYDLGWDAGAADARLDQPEPAPAAPKALLAGQVLDAAAEALWTPRPDAAVHAFRPRPVNRPDDDEEWATILREIKDDKRPGWDGATLSWAERMEFERAEWRERVGLPAAPPVLEATG